MTELEGVGTGPLGPSDLTGRILIAEDEPDMRTLISIVLEEEGFEVIEARDGEEAISGAHEHKPDLILLDVMMPRLNGLEACRRLRSDLETSTTPIILLSAKASLNDTVAGLSHGADDYIVKPFDPIELVARVRSTLNRSRQMTAVSPLTHLPGNAQIAFEIARQLEAKDSSKIAVLHLDIDYFKAFNDYYGFARGDEAIKLLARSAMDVLHRLSPDKSFLGHLGGDDFIAITDPTEAETVAAAMIEDWDVSIRNLCDPDDLELGYLEVRSRLGELRRFPIPTLSIGIASNVHRPLKTHREISELAAEMKKFAKSQTGSVYAVDKRKEPFPQPTKAEAALRIPTP
ncbi:MAG TPA: response regulator [Actinomycetota bacterium]|nr:response regulator [Actinomycetota bacterium]